MLRPVVAAAFLVLALSAFAGKYNPTLSIGDAAPEWEALPGIDGENYAPETFQKMKVLVVAFTCNTCPYAKDHEERLVALAKSFERQPVRLVAINCNSGDEDSLEAMQRRAKDKGLRFAYLKDETGAVGKAFGASRTPEFVVLNEERKVVYLGALDDDPKGKDVKTRYVEEAVKAALEGSAPAVTETPPIGCGIKYPRERRRPKQS